MPYATQVPVIVSVTEDEIILSFHLAKANPQTKTLEDNKNVLVQFTGAHGYVSSSWYAEEEVSTWNYQEAQLVGTCIRLSDDELMGELKSLTNHYEHGDDARTFESLSDDVLKQAKGIIGYRIHVKESGLKFKLSQNRSDEDYENIVNHLKNSSNQNNQQLAHVMKKNRQSMNNNW